ncbi:MAG: MFS transporter [Opitutales bacterium]|nr:MFS transporter [Opitutales bacterium]
MQMYQRSFFLLLIIYIGFISLGLPDGSFGLVWPLISKELSLPIGLAGTIVILGTILSGCSGFLSGKAINRMGTGAIVLVSCILTGSGLLAMGHIHGALALYAITIPLGIGAGAVDAGLNSFVAQHYSGRHMNWLHACWGIGATTGPLLMGYSLNHDSGWRGGYTLLASIQLSLSLLFLLSLNLWSSVPAKQEHSHVEDTTGNILLKTANSLPGYLSMLAFVLYVGVETMTGLWIGTILMSGRGFSPETASLCTASYYGAITGGRFIIGFVVDRIGNRRLIRYGLGIALIGALLFTCSGGPAPALLSLTLIGGGFAPIYPCLMHEVPQRFTTKDVAIVIGRQTGASYLGAAAIPALAGWVAQTALPGLPLLTLGGVITLLVCIWFLDRVTPVS